jgi:hypothetical protein
MESKRGSGNDLFSLCSPISNAITFYDAQRAAERLPDGNRTVEADLVDHVASPEACLSRGRGVMRTLRVIEKSSA